MTNKIHNDQLALIDAHLITLEYELKFLKQLQQNEADSGNFVMLALIDVLMVELEAARLHCRQFTIQ